MTITLTLPGLGSQGLSSKDAVISILSARWPLSLKQMHQIAKTEYAVSATYQAIHKMVSLLVEEGVVSKGEQGYSLNPDWIQRVKSFSERLNKNYSKSISFSELQNKDLINLYFDNFGDMARFIIHVFNGEFPNSDKKPRIAMMLHTWMPIGASEQDFLQLKKIFEIPYYGLYRGYLFSFRVYKALFVFLKKQVFLSFYVFFAWFVLIVKVLLGGLPSWKNSFFCCKPKTPS